MDGDGGRGEATGTCSSPGLRAGSKHFHFQLLKGRPRRWVGTTSASWSKSIPQSPASWPLTRKLLGHVLQAQETGVPSTGSHPTSTRGPCYWARFGQQGHPAGELALHLHLEISGLAEDGEQVWNSSPPLCDPLSTITGAPEAASQGPPG